MDQRDAKEVQRKRWVPDWQEWGQWERGGKGDSGSSLGTCYGLVLSLVQLHPTGFLAEWSRAPADSLLTMRCALPWSAGLTGSPVSSSCDATWLMGEEAQTTWALCSQWTEPSCSPDVLGNPPWLMGGLGYPGNLQNLHWEQPWKSSTISLHYRGEGWGPEGQEVAPDPLFPPSPYSPLISALQLVQWPTLETEEGQWWEAPRTHDPSEYSALWWGGTDTLGRRSLSVSAAQVHGGLGKSWWESPRHVSSCCHLPHPKDFPIWASSYYLAQPPWLRQGLLNSPEMYYAKSWETNLFEGEKIMHLLGSASMPAHWTLLE